MKGIIFNLLERVVVEEHGEAAWERLLDETGLSGAWTAVGNYSDEQLDALVEVAARVLSIDKQAVVRWFGERSFPMLAQSYPRFFTAHDGTRSFLLTLNDIIHVEVRKLYPGAATPVFDYETPTPDSLVMGYHSPRHLCALAEGFIVAAARHFHEDLDMEQTQCVLRGDQACTFRLRFSKRALTPDASHGAGR